MNNVFLILCFLAAGFGLYLSIKGSGCLYRRETRLGLVYLLIGILLLLVLAVPIGIQMRHSRRRHRPNCLSHLYQIGKACLTYSIYHDGVFPTSFIQVTNFLHDPKSFICTESGHKPGPIHLVDEWTDYVLVTNLSANSDSELILTYCKPENHENKGCNVLFVDASGRWFDTEDFSNLTCNVKAHSRMNTREPQK